MKNFFFLTIIFFFLMVGGYTRHSSWRNNNFNLKEEANSQSKVYKGVYALSWLGGFCSQKYQQYLNYKYYKKGKDTNPCSKSLIQLWDGQSFTIHGLWPQNHDQNSDESDFKVKNIKGATLIDKLNNFMPPRYSLKEQNKYKLWEHEYQNHGKDFVQIIKKLKSKKYESASDDVLQTRFFSAIVDFYENINPTKIKEPLLKKQFRKNEKFLLSKQDLSSILNLKEDIFFVQCQSDAYGEYLFQIKICVQISNENDHITVKKGQCLSGSSRDTCQGKFRLVDFDWDNKQERVVQDDAENDEASSEDSQENDN